MYRACSHAYKSVKTDDAKMKRGQSSRGSIDQVPMPEVYPANIKNSISSCVKPSIKIICRFRI